MKRARVPVGAERLGAAGEGGAGWVAVAESACGAWGGAMKQRWAAGAVALAGVGRWIVSQGGVERGGVPMKRGQVAGGTAALAGVRRRTSSQGGAADLADLAGVGRRVASQHSAANLPGSRNAFMRAQMAAAGSARQAVAVR